MEKNIDTIMHFCFFFPIQYGFVLFLDHYKGNNCVHMHPGMYFRLSFAFDFYNHYYYRLYIFLIINIEFKNKNVKILAFTIW